MSKNTKTKQVIMELYECNVKESILRDDVTLLSLGFRIVEKTGNKIINMNKTIVDTKERSGINIFAELEQYFMIISTHFVEKYCYITVFYKEKIELKELIDQIVNFFEPSYFNLMQIENGTGKLMKNSVDMFELVDKSKLKYKKISKKTTKENEEIIEEKSEPEKVEKQ